MITEKNTQVPGSGFNYNVIHMTFGGEKFTVEGTGGPDAGVNTAVNYSRTSKTRSALTISASGTQGNICSRKIDWVLSRDTSTVINCIHRVRAPEGWDGTPTILDGHTAEPDSRDDALSRDYETNRLSTDEREESSDEKGIEDAVPSVEPPSDFNQPKNTVFYVEVGNKVIGGYRKVMIRGADNVSTETVFGEGLRVTVRKGEKIETRIIRINDLDACSSVISSSKSDTEYSEIIFSDASELGTTNG